jgi:hypothetical protein
VSTVLERWYWLFLARGDSEVSIDFSFLGATFWILFYCSESLLTPEISPKMSMDPLGVPILGVIVTSILGFTSSTVSIY